MAAEPSKQQPSAGKPSTPSSDEATLSLSAEKRIDQVCLAFEEAWKAGRQPRPKDYLGAATGAERSALLRELTLIELDYRRRLGQIREYQLLEKLGEGGMGSSTRPCTTSSTNWWPSNCFRPAAPVIPSGSSFSSAR